MLQKNDMVEGAAGARNATTGAVYPQRQLYERAAAGSCAERMKEERKLEKAVAFCKVAFRGRL